MSLHDCWNFVKLRVWISNYTTLLMGINHIAMHGAILTRVSLIKRLAKEAFADMILCVYVWMSFLTSTALF